MTFFARVTSDLTRSWLLYQGLIFVIVMLFVPDGIGGLISVHARRLRATAVRHLTVPYLLWLVVGVLLAVGLVFVVESVHVVLSDAYVGAAPRQRRRLVPYRLFGRDSSIRGRHGPGPFPRASILAGAALLPLARRLTDQGMEPGAQRERGMSARRDPVLVLARPAQVVRRDAHHPRGRPRGDARPAPRPDRPQRRGQDRPCST